MSTCRIDRDSRSGSWLEDKEEEMGIFDFMKPKDINEGYRQFLAKPGAVLLDVREKDEFQSGHIEGARNLPLSRIAEAERTVPDKDAALFVYCLSGGRSGQAKGQLERMGYRDVTNIGGISGYTGKKVR